MFNANDARRYPGFFTRTWTPPPDGFSFTNARSRRSRGALSHATPPPLTPRLASPIDVRGLSATDPLGRLEHSRASPTEVQASRALVGMSRDEPDISPHISTLDVSGLGAFTAAHPSRRGWEDMPQEERMAYTTRLEEDVGHAQATLDRAYHLRDHYKEEAARLQRELLQNRRALDRLERDHRQCKEIIYRHQRGEVDLRQRLDHAEGEVHRLKTLLQSEEEVGGASVVQAERHLRLKQSEVDALLEEKRQLEEQVRVLMLELSNEHHSASVREGAVTKPTSNLHGEDGEEELSQTRQIIQVLRTELQDLRQQLQNERSQHEGALDEIIKQRNGLQGVNTSLRDEIEGLKERCCLQNKTLDELREELLQRAPLTHTEHHALVQRCEELKGEIERLQARESDSRDKALELEKLAIQQQLFALRADGEEKNSMLHKTRADLAHTRDHVSTLQDELELTRKAKTLLDQELLDTMEKLHSAKEENKEAEKVIKDFNRRLQDQFSRIHELQAHLDLLQRQKAGSSANTIPSRPVPLTSEGAKEPLGQGNAFKTSNKESCSAEATIKMRNNQTQDIPEPPGMPQEEDATTQDDDKTAANQPADEMINILQQLSVARATVEQLSAERGSQAARLAELTAAVARLESSADASRPVVDALTAELRETQGRLRQAEEEASQLAERLRVSEERRESAVAAGSANAALATQLSTPLTALERLAEERETLAGRSSELEERVKELERELRE
ncbi:NUP-1 protein, partial [Trypanosoma conorhini]